MTTFKSASENTVSLEKTDVLILCGGLGKRLRPVVSDSPKPMAKIHGSPFLDILIEYVASFGFRRFILCCGYMGETIRDYYTAKSIASEIVFCMEEEPLGTGGAIKNAKPYIKSSHFVVTNGDSFCSVDLADFIKFHITTRGVMTIALTKVKDENSGKVLLDKNNKIVRFEEKGQNKSEYYSSVGIYCMEQTVFPFMANMTKFSLEYDLIPDLVQQSCYGYVTDKELIDIGTPISYNKAQKLFSTRMFPLK